MTDETRWDEANKLWDAFLNKFPAEKIESMTLAEYTAFTAESDAGSFTYWLEHRLMDLGSIRGGSSLKFGVWRTGEKSKLTNTKNDGGYAWHTKYGASSPQEAFETIKQRIKATIEAVQRADLSAIESIGLPDSLKWKVAFMYQDRAQPCVLNVFTPDALRLYLGTFDKKSSVADLQKEVMARRENKALFAFGREVWGVWSEDVMRHFKFKNKVHRDFKNAAKAWNKEQKLFFIEVVTSFNRLGFDWYFIEPKTSTAYTLRVARKKEPSKTFTVLGYFNFKKIVFIREPKSTKGTEEEHRFGADRQADFSLWFDKNFGHEVEMEGSNKKGNWPDAYDEAEEVNDEGETNAANEKGTNMNTEMPLNQILYGPPGTGKTYATIDKALEIIDPSFLAQHSENRTELKKRFDVLVAEGHIKFTTFHQSFSYEDFVEGIRADAGGDDEKETGLTYRVESGVFKRICDAARASTLEVESFGVNEKPKVWKISIESAGDSEVKEYCFKNGEARIGWGDKGELTSDKLTELSGKVGTNDHRTLRDFAQNMQIGDILLCISSVTEVGRVGIVESDYVFEADVPTGMREDYCNVRKVKWLPFSEKFSILPLNESKRFTLKTVYELWRITWEDIVQVLQRESPTLPKKEAKPYVLVIDEINRGNVSRVFGELITLIEPSKREGNEEALSLTLPYSGKSFSVPKNVYIIGTMNSADRSLLGLDVALRRRFVFSEMPPQPELLDKLTIDGVNVGQLLRVMNQRIEVLLDREHCLGHAYFMPLKDDPAPSSKLTAIFKNQILPLLQEYFFEDWERISWVLNDMNKKDKRYQFIQKPQENKELLFGSEVAGKVEDRRWVLNLGAFDHIESYQQIIAVTP